ncbi:hypothetical protein D6777_01280 [Candidatus Woesearchaeota archaeon]|nr:MAG: hypothetical protein D6777_01280 [Candidatus Woesearchaeota archaeon]
MKDINLNYKNSMVNKDEMYKTLRLLEGEIVRMNEAKKINYLDDRASINLPTDAQLRKTVKNVVHEKLKLKPNNLVVVGIGGSNLGTMAVQEALLGKNYNLDANLKVFYADTVDADNISSIIKHMKKGKTILNIISKSGTTVETIANFKVLLEELKKKVVNYNKYVVITTEKESMLYNYAVENNIDVFEIPKKVGGRYSVFSPVGLFPLAMLGVDIDKLHKGATRMVKLCTRTVKLNPAALSAAVLYNNYMKGRVIYNTFLFSNDLESLGKWCRQLAAESLGKVATIKMSSKNVGIMPIVSIGSTDLHSMAQYYFGGLDNVVHTLVKVNEKNKVNVPNEKNGLIDDLNKLSLNKIMSAIYNGFALALAKAGRPYMEIDLFEKNEYFIGQFMQLKMIETMFLGKLLNVNPFNQPDVEKYKQETKKILKLS